METVFYSSNKRALVGPLQPFLPIGARINPSGRARLSRELACGEQAELARDVAEQVAGGAGALDVNVQVPGLDEAETMGRTVRFLQSVTDLPLCLDSASPTALEAGLEAYEGKALVNSVAPSSMHATFPLVRRYAAAAVLLPAESPSGASEPSARLELARKMADVATTDYGIEPCDLVVDALSLPLSSGPSEVARTLETIGLIREELGLNTIVGACNVSFGAPGRSVVEAAFLVLGLAAGLSCGLVDVRSRAVMEVVGAAGLLLGRSHPAATEEADARRAPHRGP